MSLDAQSEMHPGGEPEAAPAPADIPADTPIESDAPLADDGFDEPAAPAEDPVATLRADLDRERNRATQLEKQVATAQSDFETRIKRLDAAARTAINNQARQIHDSYNAAKRTAVADGDVQRYDDLNRAHAQAIKDFDETIQREQEAATPAKQEAPAQPQAAQLPPEVQKAVTDFTAKHATWWEKDPEMTETAVAIHGILRQSRKDMSIDQNLAEVERRLAAMYPDKFRRAPAAQLQGGSRMPAQNAPRGKGWSDIPKEDRGQAERFITDGLFFKPGVKKEQATERDVAEASAAYAKEYWGAA